jgi:hypothetical protein
MVLRICFAVLPFLAMSPQFARAEPAQHKRLSARGAAAPAS